MPFIQHNLDLIVAGSAVIVLITLYIIIKKKTKNKQKTYEIDDYSNIEIIEDMYAKEEDRNDKTDLTDNRPQPSSQIKKTAESEEKRTKTSENHNPKSKISKTEVPPHGKIVKDNFKDFAGLKILVAEDNLINQKVIAGMLNESDIDITFANDGLETISFLNNQKDFDIILMDAHMPNMDGFEATRKIRENRQFDNIPIIALSGDVAADDVKKMYEAGMDAHLEKPLKMDALYDALYAFTKNKDVTEEESEETLDITAGIQISGGDESFYKEILSEFVKDYGDAKKRIKSLLEAGDFKSADALLLDLTGITANIGAQKAHSSALSLREALKQKTTAAYKEAYRKFADSFDMLLKKVKDYLV